MPITEQQLLQILPNAGHQAGVFVPVLNTAMSKYGIVNRLRVAAGHLPLPGSEYLLHVPVPIAGREVAPDRGMDIVAYLLLTVGENVARQRAWEALETRVSALDVNLGY